MEPLLRYFDGEKQAGSLAILLGALSIAFAGWLFRGASPFRAMLVPLVIFGLIQVGVGIGLHARTPAQVAALEAGLRGDFTKERAGEIERMRRVQRNFGTLKIAWIVILMAGVSLVMGMARRPVAVGVGMALAIHAAVMLAFDVFAERRGSAYLEYLEGLTPATVG
jgi:hypothetical protein